MNPARNSDHGESKGETIKFERYAKSGSYRTNTGQNLIRLITFLYVSNTKFR
jgi:hypothetical protein